MSERYQILDRIGAGGLGVVHRVEDTASGEICAMKVMPRSSGTANLRGEFLALARLHHDNVVEVFDYGVTENGQDFFTMQYIEGPPLLDAVPQVPSPMFYDIVGGILHALAFLHARGMVHADVKPSNILIDAERLATDPVRAVRVVDFGLSAAIEDPASSAARGTFPYAAPEVYAGRLDARSDLYALGVVLYEMATGEKPYIGSDVTTVLAAQRRGPPVNPRELRPELPADLCDLILSLLDPAPGARPQTADEVLSLINDVAGTHFDVQDSRPLLDLGGTFVGRERDRTELTRMWTEAGRQRGGVALLCGEEGIGKSRLMAELRLAIQLDGGRVHAIDVATRNAVPYAGISQLVRALLAELGGRAQEITSEWRRALAPLVGGRLDSPPDHGSRFALAEAVTGVLFELASTRPLLITIDDVHLADGATAELLAYLARSVAESSVLLVMAGRDEPPEMDTGRASGSPFELIARAVHNAERGQRFDLTPLDRHSVYRLADRTFGEEIAKRLGAELYRTSGGNPSHAAQALEAMVKAGTIARDRGRWRLKDDATIPMPRDVMESALARADQLPEQSRRVLDTAAVLGETFTRRALVALFDTDEKATAANELIDAALADGAAARLIQVDASLGTFRFAHRGVSEALYRALDDDSRLSTHRRAVAILEELAGSGAQVPAASLARHYLAVKDRERGIERGIKAAEQYMASYDHHGALAWTARIRPLVEDDDLAATLDEQLGDLRTMIGEIKQATGDYRRACDANLDRPRNHIRLSLRLGELLRKQGDSDAALEVLMSALEEARKHQLSDLEARCHLRIGWVRMYRAEYKAAAEHAVTGNLMARAGNDRATAAELGRLAAAIDIFRGDTRTPLVHLQRALADAEAVGDAVLIAGVHHEIGRAAIQAGDYDRAIDALEKAIPIAEQVGHIEQSARSLNNLGAACYYQGDWERARSSWERFRRLCERLDEQSELVNALNNLGSLYRDLGQFSQALEALARGAEVAALTDHAFMAAMVLGNKGEVMFRQGDIAGARDCYNRALVAFERIGANEDIIESQRRLCELDVAAGKLPEALDRAVEAARAAKDAGTRLEEGILHRVAATALRLQGDLESSEWFGDQAREILTQIGARYHRAKLDLETSELLSALGRPTQAAEYLHNASETFANLGARWDLNRTRARERAMPSAKPGIRTNNSPHVGLDLLLELTQATANTEIERLLEIALDRMLALTGFERGFILLLDSEGRPSERTRRVREGAKGFERDEAEFSGTIVRRVAASGDAMSVSDIAEEDDLREQKSVVALGLRQIMCAPMRARGRVIGIVYIDSRRLQFEEQTIDLTLLEAFAAQLALGIENARLITEEHRQAELLAILAHEVRNPLAGVLGYADIGETDGDLPDCDTTELFGNIRRDAERLKRLVDNVLELARHESGNVDWSMMPFDIGELVDDAVSSYQPQCDLKEIHISANTESLTGSAFGNPDRIMQVITNLIGNAVKFTPSAGSIAVIARNESVSATDPEAPPIPPTDIGAWTPIEPSHDVLQDFVRVDVRDTGPGMTEEVRARLFQKFSQGGGKQRARGVGLGLYISRGIIAHHGGSIFVDSEPGQGSTFSFRIPLVDE